MRTESLINALQSFSPCRGCNLVVVLYQIQLIAGVQAAAAVVITTITHIIAVSITASILHHLLRPPRRTSHIPC